MKSIESRGTKSFTAKSASGYPGSFPVGFLPWVKSMGWWGDKRIYLCSGGVVDDEADRVDIQKEINVEELKGRKGTHQSSRRSRIFKTSANIIADARDTGLPDESYDWVMIDPPYSADLADRMYGTEDHYSGINKFLKEGLRLCKPGGYVLTFCYEVPRWEDNADIIGAWGIYQIPAVRNMTALFIYRKHGDRRLQGLNKWIK